MNISTLSADLGKALDADSIELPFLVIPKGYRIKVIFPHCGALIRFLIERIETGKTISVYCDSKAQLGYMEQPYFEAYAIDGDCKRYMLDESAQMMKDIIWELNQ